MTILPGWALISATALFALGVLLTIAKAAGLIAWPWWVVLLPFAPMALLAAVFVLLVLGWAASGCH